MRVFIIFQLLLIFHDCRAQSDTTYFDSFNNLTRAESAKYFRIVTKDDSIYYIKEYFTSSNSIKLLEQCSSYHPVVKNGKASYYNSKGYKSEEGNYQNNVKTGIWTSWYDAGKDSSIIEYFSDGTKRTLRKPNLTYSYVEQMPSFPGGDKALYEYLRNNIKNPDGKTGKVFVGFVVKENGVISEMKILRSLSAETDKEVLRVISQMPTWIPGKQNSENVSVSYSMPINFK